MRLEHLYGLIKTVDLNFNELRELVAALSQTDVAELTLKSAEFELTLRKSSAVGTAVGQSPPASPAPLPVTASKAADDSITPDLPVPPPPPPPAVNAAANLLKITSPIVGTFYRAPGPDEAAFVEVGDRIQSGQTVCIIEAMKLMNEIEAEISGEVVEVLVDNSEPVEFGQTLMLVRPA